MRAIFGLAQAMLYWLAMDEQQLQIRWSEATSRWRTGLQKYHLEAIAAAFLDALEPVAVVGAQVLYVLQPALGFLVRHEIIADWATLLETPGGVAWLRQQLVEDLEDER
jgi:hypothetical protein